MIRPNILDPQSDNIRLKCILSSSRLRKKFEALLLLNCPTISDIFGLPSEDIKEYKIKYFNIDELLSLGRPYIIDYLESTGQRDILDYYLNGEEYTKAKLGLSPTLDGPTKSSLMDSLLSGTIMKSLKEEDLSIRLKCIKILSKEIKPPAEESVLDKLQEILKDEDV